MTLTVGQQPSVQPVLRIRMKAPMYRSVQAMYSKAATQAATVCLLSTCMARSCTQTHSLSLTLWCHQLPITHLTSAGREALVLQQHCQCPEDRLLAVQPHHHQQEPWNSHTAATVAQDAFADTTTSDPSGMHDTETLQLSSQQPPALAPGTQHNWGVGLLNGPTFLESTIAR